MAFLGLKVLAGVAQGVKKIATKIKDKKETKIQKRIDSAIDKKASLGGLFGDAPVNTTVANTTGGAVLPTVNPFRAAAAGLFRSKPDLQEDQVKEGIVLGGKPQSGSSMPSWLIPAGLVLAAIFVLPNLFRRKR